MMGWYRRRDHDILRDESRDEEDTMSIEEKDQNIEGADDTSKHSRVGFGEDGIGMTYQYSALAYDVAQCYSRSCGFGFRHCEADSINQPSFGFFPRHRRSVWTNDYFIETVRPNRGGVTTVSTTGVWLLSNPCHTSSVPHFHFRHEE